MKFSNLTVSAVKICKEYLQTASGKLSIYFKFPFLFISILFHIFGESSFPRTSTGTSPLNPTRGLCPPDLLAPFQKKIPIAATVCWTYVDLQFVPDGLSAMIRV